MLHEKSPESGTAALCIMTLSLCMYVYACVCVCVCVGAEIRMAGVDVIGWVVVVHLGVHEMVLPPCMASGAISYVKGMNTIYIYTYIYI